MFSRGDSANAGVDGGTESTSYPTQWALNPSAYSGVDASAVDWAALAQQWIQMKDAAPLAPVTIAPPAPVVSTPLEDTSDAMELEESDAPPAPNLPATQWAGVNSAPATSWSGTPGWNQWGWGWSGAGESKTDTITSVSHINYAANETPVSGYTTAALAAPTYQSGYWTAPVESQTPLPEVTARKSYETKSSSRNRRNRERPAHVAPPTAATATPLASTVPTLDAAKRKQLPAWIREGLEKMEREKARAAERAAEDAALAAAEKERKETEEREMERIRAEGGLLPAKSKFDSDSEGEPGSDAEVKTGAEEEVVRGGDVSPVQGGAVRSEPVVQRSKEEILQEMMLVVRRTLTEILLEVTDHEVHTVSQEELARYYAAQASSLNAVGKSKALSAITSGLGLAVYGSSDSESGSEDEVDAVTDITDVQLQDIIRKRRQQFEKTSREIEAELRAAEAQDEEDGGTEGPVQVDATNGEKTNHSSTPELRQRTHSRHSATPPPIDREQLSKLTAASQRRHSIDSKESKRKLNKNDKKRLETIQENPKKSGKGDRTPSPAEERSHTPSKQSDSSNSSSSEDSESSSDSSSSSSSTNGVKSPPHKKRKRESSADSSVQRRVSKKQKKDKKQSKSSVAEKDRDGKYSKKDKDDERSYSKHRNEHKEKSSKSSRRNYDEYYEKTRKYDKESKSTKKKDEEEYYEKSYKYEKESKARRKEDDEYERHEKEHTRRYKHSESRDYDKSHRDKYREEEDRHKRHKRSRSTTYDDKRDKRSRSREHSEDRYRWDERSRRKERRRSRDKSYDRYSSRSGREHGGHRERERRSRSRSRAHRR